MDSNGNDNGNVNVNVICNINGYVEGTLCYKEGDSMMDVLKNGHEKQNGHEKKIVPCIFDMAGVIHIEVCQSSKSRASSEDIRQKVLQFIKKILDNPNDVYPSNGYFTDFKDSSMKEEIESIYIPEIRRYLKSRHSVSAHFHIFQLNETPSNTEDIGEGDECIVAANNWILPCREFVGLWESLEFDINIKSNLMKYANTALLFSERGIDPKKVTWNKVILFHGPPGTGKTTLCKALAQKLSIYMAHKYKYGQLVEINSHSLFSKWFSESGKLVSKMFDKIRNFISDKDSFVMVLIDEIESLTAARKQAFKSAEPSDAIRVVNALLTQLDEIRRYPNVLIMTTSNITGAIDVAFIDRADIKQYIGPPSSAAIYRILDSCLDELMKANIIRNEPIICYESIKNSEKSSENESHATKIGSKLREICDLCHSYGFSGRTLRKLTFLCYSNYILPAVNCELNDFLDALEKQVKDQKEERDNLEKECRTIDEAIQKNNPTSYF